MAAGDTPAAAAGIPEAATLRSVDGKAVSTREEVDAALAAAGDTFRVVGWETLVELPGQGGKPRGKRRAGRAARQPAGQRAVARP